MRTAAKRVYQDDPILEIDDLQNDTTAHLDERYDSDMDWSDNDDDMESSCTQSPTPLNERDPSFIRARFV